MHPNLGKNVCVTGLMVRYFMLLEMYTILSSFYVNLLLAIGEICGFSVKVTSFMNETCAG
jgi:hypothetical protein